MEELVTSDNKGKWKTKEYYEGEVEGVCSTRGYKFVGFVGAWRASHTKVSLTCSNNHSWDTDIHNLLRGSGCRKCASASISKSGDAVIKELKANGSYKEGMLLWKSDRVGAKGQKYWSYTCPICSSDEYVRAGLCTGVFETLTATICIGGLSCRCNKCYRWTQQQKEYQVNKVIMKMSLPYKIVGWGDGYKRSDSKITLQCEQHGNFSTTTNNFIKNHSRCPSCSSQGFDPTKDSSLYVLRIEGETGGFTGYGISRNVDTRIKTHTTNLSTSGFRIVETQLFNMIGQRALDIENLLKHNFPVTRQEVTGFKTEATFTHLFDDVVSFVAKHSHI